MPCSPLVNGSRRQANDDAAGSVWRVLVFRDANSAARCARAGLYVTQHQPVIQELFNSGDPARRTPTG